MERVIKTRVKEGAEPVSTKLSFDFSGLSREEVEAQAIRSLSIDLQNEWRKAGHIPTEHTCNVREFLDRERKAAVRDPLAILAKMSPEERAAAFAKFGLGVE